MKRLSLDIDLEAGMVAYAFDGGGVGGSLALDESDCKRLQNIAAPLEAIDMACDAVMQAVFQAERNED